MLLLSSQQLLVTMRNLVPPLEIQQSKETNKHDQGSVTVPVLPQGAKEHHGEVICCRLQRATAEIGITSAVPKPSITKLACPCQDSLKHRGTV